MSAKSSRPDSEQESSTPADPVAFHLGLRDLEGDHNRRRLYTTLHTLQRGSSTMKSAARLVPSFRQVCIRLLSPLPLFLFRSLRLPLLARLCFSAVVPNQHDMTLHPRRLQLSRSALLFMSYS